MNSRSSGGDVGWIIRGWNVVSSGFWDDFLDVLDIIVHKLVSRGAVRSKPVQDDLGVASEMTPGQGNFQMLRRELN